MNLIFSIVLIFLTILLLLSGFIILKDRFEFILRFERLFHVFLDLQQNSADFLHSFFHSLCSEMKFFFKARASFLFLCDNTRIQLQTEDIDVEYKKIIKSSLHHESISISSQDILDLTRGRLDMSILEKLIPAARENHHWFKKIIILPIIQDSTLTSFFLFQYRRNIPFLRARKIIWLHQKRLSSILLSITNVTRSKEQNIFNLMLENIRDYAFITSDITYRITSWNKGAEIMFGFEYDDIFGKSLFDLVQPTDSEILHRALDISQMKEETKLKINMWDCNQTGLVCEILLKQIKLNDIHMGFYILIKDISKEEVLKANMKKKSLINRSIVENARDGIILLNAEDKIIFYNEKIKVITESKLSFLGMEIHMVFPQQYGEQIRDKVQEVRHNWEDFQYLDLKIGELWFNIRFFPIIEDENYTGIIMFFIDNTLRMYTRMELESKKEELEKINQALLENLASARIMQQNLIPHQLPQSPLVRFESIYQTSDMLGGDFFYVEEVKMDEQIYYVAVIADVSGHGVTASMFSVLVRNTYSEFMIRLRSQYDLHPTRLLDIMNEKILNLNLLDSSLSTSKFITAFIYVMNPAERTLHYSSAGHPRAVLQHREGSVEFLGIEKSPPLGLYEEITFQEKNLLLQQGDRIVLYSDGLLDIMEGEGNYEDQLSTYFLDKKERDISLIRDDILERARQFAETAEIDDITVLFTSLEK